MAWRGLTRPEIDERYPRAAKQIVKVFASVPRKGYCENDLVLFDDGLEGALYIEGDPEKCVQILEAALAHFRS